MMMSILLGVRLPSTLFIRVVNYYVGSVFLTSPVTHHLPCFLSSDVTNVLGLDSFQTLIEQRTDKTRGGGQKQRRDPQMEVRELHTHVNKPTSEIVKRRKVLGCDFSLTLGEWMGTRGFVTQ